MIGQQARLRGFTLLEVVVAIAIFAAMYMLAQQFFSSALRNRDVLETHAQQLEQSQRTLIFLTSDMEQIIARPARDRFGDRHPAVEGGDDQVSITRLGWANPFELRKRSRMQRVFWRLEDNQLIRGYYPALDRGTDQRPTENVMMDDVKEFAVRYLQEGEEDDWQWVRRWPATGARDTPAEASASVLRQSLPRSIEITITREEGDDLHRFFRIVSNPWS